MWNAAQAHVARPVTQEKVVIFGGNNSVKTRPGGDASRLQRSRHSLCDGAAA